MLIPCLHAYEAPVSKPIITALLRWGWILSIFFKRPNHKVNYHPFTTYSNKFMASKRKDKKTWLKPNDTTLCLTILLITRTPFCNILTINRRWYRLPPITEKLLVIICHGNWRMTKSSIAFNVPTTTIDFESLLLASANYQLLAKAWVLNTSMKFIKILFPKPTWWHLAAYQHHHSTEPRLR